MDFRFVETGNSAPLSWPSVNSPSPNSPKRRTHPGMNERSSRFDDDRDLIVVAVAEPVKWHCCAKRRKAHYAKTSSPDQHPVPRSDPPYGNWLLDRPGIACGFACYQSFAITRCTQSVREAGRN